MYAIHARLKESAHYVQQAAARLGIAALEYGPEKVGKAIRAQTDNVGMPRLGYEGNYAFSTFQTNIASTKRASDSACMWSFTCVCTLR